MRQMQRDGCAGAARSAWSFTTAGVSAVISGRYSAVLRKEEDPRVVVHGERLLGRLVVES